MDYVKKYYDLPFLVKGMRVEADGKPGVINREKNGYLEIYFDDGKKAPAHPTWEMVYFDNDGQIIKDFRKIKISNKAEIASENKPEFEVFLEGKQNIQITENLKIIYLNENSWDDDKLIAIECTFLFYGKEALAFIIVKNLDPEKPRYGSIESEDEIHDSFKNSLTSLPVWEKMVPVLQQFKNMWEEYKNLPF